jgi:hypothetical protein
MLPQRGVRGAAKLGITAFLLVFYYIICCQFVIFNQLGVPPNFFKGPEGCREPKKVEKHWSKKYYLRQSSQVTSVTRAFKGFNHHLFIQKVICPTFECIESCQAMKKLKCNSLELMFLYSCIEK